MWTFTRSVKIHILRSCSFPDWDVNFRDNSCQCFRKLSRVFGKSEVLEGVNREVKHDVIGRRQTAKIASDFEFFCFVRKIKHTKMEKRLLLFIANTNNFTLLYTQLKRDGKSSIFAVCRLP